METRKTVICGTERTVLLEFINVRNKPGRNWSRWNGSLDVESCWKNCIKSFWWKCSGDLKDSLRLCWLAVKNRLCTGTVVKWTISVSKRAGGVLYLWQPLLHERGGSVLEDYGIGDGRVTTPVTTLRCRRSRRHWGRCLFNETTCHATVFPRVHTFRYIQNGRGIPHGSCRIRGTARVPASSRNCSFGTPVRIPGSVCCGGK